MPIILNGQLLVGKTEASPTGEAKPITAEPKNDFAIEQNDLNAKFKKNYKSRNLRINDGNTLIVNGKAKTIGRKSQYLLDMMIIDDE